MKQRASNKAGRGGGRTRRRWARRVAVAILSVGAVVVVGVGVLWLAFPFPMERLEGLPHGTLVVDCEGRVLRGYLSPGGECVFPVPYEGLSPQLIEATLAVEDGRFERHCGVDFFAVGRAAWQNVSRGRIVSGASTITMQLVRMIEDRPRTLVSKAIEAFRAVQIERVLDKREIVQAYLNFAPYGSNIRGAEAAALRYFGKRSRDLTLGEAALLAGLPKSPSRYRPDRHLERALGRQRFVLGEMLRRGVIDEGELRGALEQPIVAAFHALPLRAPHACDLVYGRNRGERLIRTTIDLGIQAVAEEALRERLGELRGEDVTNGAVVVVENRTGAVRALVGSADYWDAREGQVNGALALRSPGSALKPFVYGLAFDAGVCTPATMLADIPVRFAGYEPENFDERFRGPVSARLALADSLNIPAIGLVNDLGPARVRQHLADCGLATLGRRASSYGLSLALGSAEVRLLELTGAYACLARLGEYRPVRLTALGSSGPERRVLSQESAFLLADCLGERERLEGAAGVAQCRTLPRLAWKTGTSTGRRDAWTLAYNPEYTVGVWLGNFDGHGSPALVGQAAASPLAFAIFAELYRERGWSWYEPPTGLLREEVCTVSGQRAGPDCPGTQGAWQIAGRRSGETCTVHRRILVDADSGHLVCPFCAGGRRVREEAATVYPVELARWLSENGQSVEGVPSHAPGCPSVASAGEMRIVSPPDGQAFVKMGGQAADNQGISLSAAAPGDAMRLYWFVDGRLFGRCDPSSGVRWPLSRGSHELRCADDRGRWAKVRIDVE